MDISVVAPCHNGQPYLARKTPLRLTSGDEAVYRRTLGEPEWKRVATSILRRVGRGLPGSRRSAGPGEPILPVEEGEPVEVRYGPEDPS